MLELLLEYGRAHGIDAESGFAPKEIKWAIELAADGRFVGVHELGEAGDKKNRGKQFPKCPELSQPELVGGSEERSHFLAESAQTVCLFFKENEKEKIVAKQQRKHDYFVGLLKQAASTEPDLEAAAQALSDPESIEKIVHHLKEQKAKPTDKVTLRIAGGYPLDSDSWHEWWRQFRALLAKPTEDKPSKKKSAAPLMRCLATGELAPPKPTHLKIQGLNDVGGLATGDSLMCYNKDAFKSYSLEDSVNGAVSEDGMVRYRAALNALIKDHGRRLAGAKVVYWFKEQLEPEENLFALLEESSEHEERSALKQARKLLDGIRKGERPDLVDNRFYAITLSGASGRVMVRDWMEGSFEQLAANIVRWFEDLRIVHRKGGRDAPDPKFLAVLGSTVRDLKDLPPPFVGKMWRTAIAGEAIPPSALSGALLRARNDLIQDKKPVHARFGLLKACLLRANQGGYEMEPYLNENHANPAYHCGRLMSVLADLQYAALRKTNTTVVQRYYAAASATPALVLGRLVRTAQHHIGKLDNPIYFQDRIADIWTKVHDEVPATLTLEEQTLFALGYYQQMAHDRAERKKNKEAENQP